MAPNKRRAAPGRWTVSFPIACPCLSILGQTVDARRAAPAARALGAFALVLGWEKVMIEAIEFTNFKALRKTTLPLAPFTLLLGPNGSGKTSVLQALQGIATDAAATQAVLAATQAGLPLHAHLNWASCRSVTAEDRAPTEIKLRLRRDEQSIIAVSHWEGGLDPLAFNHANGTKLPLFDAQVDVLLDWLGRMQVYALDFSAIAQPAQVNARPLQRNGAGLAAVLDDLKDNYPDRWELLLAEMRRWLPEYDHILFDKPQAGSKAIVLRTKKGGHRIPASALSQGTLVALALLTLAYVPSPPSLIGLEEVDRGCIRACCAICRTLSIGSVTRRITESCAPLSRSSPQRIRPICSTCTGNTPKKLSWRRKRAWKCR